LLILQAPYMDNVNVTRIELEHPILFKEITEEGKKNGDSVFPKDFGGSWL